MHGKLSSPESLETLEQRWLAIACQYDEKRPRSWHKQKTSIRARTLHANARHNAKLAADDEGRDLLIRIYELAYSEGCRAAHPSPGTILDQAIAKKNQITLLIGPQQPESDEALQRIALHLMMLGNAVSDEIGRNDAVEALTKVFSEKPGD